MTDSVPIIVGAARSGTTLLRAMLDSHPQLAITPESYFLVSLAKSRRFTRQQPFDLDSFVAALLHHPRFQRWGLPPENVAKDFRQPTVDNHGAAFRILYAAYGAHHRKSRVGDKTPWYVHHIPFIAELLPEARFVHVIRDGRDVALSQGRGPILGALNWRRAINDGKSAAARLGAGRVLEVKYEDLVTHPEASLRNVCMFLDLDYDSAMLAYTDHADRIRAGFNRPESVAHARISESPSLRRDGWQVRMHTQDVLQFEHLAGRSLIACGYELSGLPRSRVVAARASVVAVSIRIQLLVRRVYDRLAH
ncbi:MAG: sulfotransferase [Acidimicrobiia bacterium]